MNTAGTQERLLFVGTYNRGDSEGIYTFRMDAASGHLESAGPPTAASDPSFLTIHPGGPYLYAATEDRGADGRVEGSVNAYAIDPKSGALQHVNRQPTRGGTPCHLDIDRAGGLILVANYTGGTVAVMRTRSDGGLEPPSHVVAHEGASGVDPDRQEGPHPHSINLDAAGRFAVAADLGQDRVLSYRLDADQGKLASADQPSVATKPGAGPRHLDFHPSGRFAYLINELGSTITAFAYDGSSGALRELHTVPALPGGFAETNYCADIHISPSGAFVYGSNRGHDSIVIYSVDGDTGMLSYVGHEPSLGKWPRNFAIDPAGETMLVANEHSSNLVTFRIDGETGELEPTGYTADVPNPVCVKLLAEAG